MPYDETLPLSTDSGQLTASINFSARDRLTYEELMRLDPQLAGLFRFGHEFATRLNEHGVVHLLAHVGRELSLGLTRVLAEEDFQTLEDNSGEIKNTERNKEKIGNMLELAPEHSLVKVWFDLHNEFVRATHYRSSSTSVEKVHSAFLQLCALLYGRIAPYFDTHAELDRLLAIESPAPEELERVRMLLVRPQLRQHFFMRLQHSSWLLFLESGGYFKNPPDRKVWPDGKWSFRKWPAGEYLARVAKNQPDRVTEILLTTPKDLQNPAVWAVVVDAAKVMPGACSSQLVPLLKCALKSAPSELFPHLAIDLVKILAEQGEPSAFDLAKALLALSSDLKVEEDGQQSDTRSRWLSGRHETEWMLKRIEVYDLKKFCGNVLPALEALDPFHTVEFFAGQLDRSIKLGQPAVDLNAWFEHDHRRWCPYLDHDVQGDDVRAVFAIAFTALAKRVSQRDPASAKAVFEVIQRYTNNSLFIRISYAVLESAGCSLQQELDTVVASGELIDPPFGAREAAALLRAQFVNASPDSKRLFRYAIERGPTADKVKGLVLMRRSYKGRETEQASDAEDPISEAEIAEAVGSWQRKRLGRFHDQLPAELQPLAERLGVKPQIPSPEDQALDEVGFYTGGGWVYGGDQSPKTPEELASIGVEDALRFLATWRPDGDSFDGPSSRGLGNALATIANEHEDFAIGLFDKGIQASLAPGYMKALLDGFFNAAEAKKVIPWERLVPIVVAVVQMSEKSETVTESQQDAALRDQHNLDDRWGEVVRATANLVREGCAKNLIPNILADDVWKYAELAVHSPLMWAGERTSSQKSLIEEALMAALNTVGGNVVRMLIDVALWDYRQGKERINSDIKQAPVSSKIVERLIPLLSHILIHQKDTALGAHAMLGHLIPQIDFLVPQWISAMEDQLFGVGAEDSGNHPIWGAYVTRAGIYNSTFSKLRKWYLRAAEVFENSVEAEDQNTGNSDWSLTKGLAIHIIVGIIRGLCNVGDEDSLVEKTFSNVPVKDRSNAYWEVFRGWSDSKEMIPVEYAQRITSFWEWRLTELEGTPDTSERADEADGLTWFLKTPYIPAEDAIRLGFRTLLLNSGKQRNRITTWERLAELANFDASKTFDLVEHLIEQEIRADYTFLPYEDVAPLLKTALSCGDHSVRTRAAHLINRLGDRGHIEFGRLLSSD